MGMPRRAMPIGPGARLQRPNFGMEQIRVARRDPSALERLPMGDMPMTQDLPEVAPIGMMPQMRMGGMQDMRATYDDARRRRCFS